MADRGRITIPFLLIFGVALSYLGAIYPVFVDLFEANAGSLDGGVEVLFMMMLPLLLLVMLYLIYLKSIGGVRV